MSFWGSLKDHLDRFDDSPWPRPGVRPFSTPDADQLALGYRVRTTGLGILALSWLWLAADLLGLLFIAPATQPLGTRVLMGVPVVVVSTVFLGQAFLCRLVFDDRKIVIRNAWSHHVVNWEDVELIAWNTFTRTTLKGDYKPRCVAIWARTRRVPIRARATVGLSHTKKAALAAALRLAADQHHVRLALRSGDLKTPWITPTSPQEPPRPWCF